MNPETVLRMASTLGTLPGQILIVACEPETLGGEEGQLRPEPDCRRRRGPRGCSGGIAGDPDLQRENRSTRQKLPKEKQNGKRWNITKIKRMTLGTL